MQSVCFKYYNLVGNQKTLPGRWPARPEERRGREIITGNGETGTGRPPSDGQVWRWQRRDLIF